MDRVRNETIRTKLGLKKDILQETEQLLRWYGRVMRMEDCRIARQVAEWNPQGKRRRDRPVSTWKDGITEVCKEGTSGMKNVSIVSSGGRKLCLWFEENCAPTGKFLYI
jgi:hypothetical protein